MYSTHTAHFVSRLFKIRGLAQFKSFFFLLLQTDLKTDAGLDVSSSHMYQKQTFFIGIA